MPSNPFTTMPAHYRLGLIILVPVMIAAFGFLLLALIGVLLPILTIVVPLVMIFFPSKIDATLAHTMEKENDLQPK